MGVIMSDLKYGFLSFLFIAAFPVLFYACCSGENCSEDTYGTTIVKQVDTIYKKVPKLQTGPYHVQIGAFVNKSNADAFASDARSKLNTQVSVFMTPEGVYRILIGEFKELDQAENMTKSAKSNGFTDAFVRDEYGPVIK
jgi:cell division septation protein DedD